MRFRRLLRILVAAVAIVLIHPGVVRAEEISPPSTENPFTIERDLSDCVSALPKPDCGRKPTASGDRGGAMQYATFAAIIAGLAVIFTVVFRNTLRADRAKAENLPENTPGYF